MIISLVVACKLSNSIGRLDSLAGSPAQADPLVIAYGVAFSLMLVRFGYLELLKSIVL